MVTGTRHVVKRRIGYSRANIKNSQEMLSQDGLMYEANHPELFAKFLLAVQTLELVDQLLAQLDESI